MCALHTRRVLEEAHVAQLVQLVGADGLDGQVLLGVGHVRGARRHDRDARARKGDLGGRCELERTVGVAGLGASREDFDQWIRRVVQIVHGVGVVPEQPEIGRGRLHARPGVRPRAAE